MPRAAVLSLAFGIHDKQAWTTRDRGQLKAQPSPVIFFPNSQTDADLFIRKVQSMQSSEKPDRRVGPKSQSLCQPCQNYQTPDFQQTLTGFKRFPFNNFTYFSLSLQSAFHLSLTVLVRNRSLTNS